MLKTREALLVQMILNLAINGYISSDNYSGEVLTVGKWKG